MKPYRTQGTVVEICVIDARSQGHYHMVMSANATHAKRPIVGPMPTLLRGGFRSCWHRIHTNRAMNKYVLVADNNEDDAFLLRRAFDLAGIADILRFVGGGSEAISYLDGSGPFADRTQFLFPSLVILELRMPKPDGFEVLQWIKSNRIVSYTAVVVLTSLNRADDIDRAYRSDANGYLVKSSQIWSKEFALAIKAFWLDCNLCRNDYSLE